MIQHWILPLVFILAGLLGGIICEKIIFTRLNKFVASRRIPGSTVILRSLNRMPFFWCFLAGFYGANVSYRPEPDVAELLKKIITGAFLYTVTVVFARLTAGFVSLFFRRTDGFSASLLSNVAKTAVLVLGTLILLQTLGVQITPILTTLGIGGLAVGLALQDTLANLFLVFI